MTSEVSRLKKSIREMFKVRDIDPPNTSGLSVAELRTIRANVGQIRTPTQQRLITSIQRAARRRDMVTPPTAGLNTNQLRSLRSKTLSKPTAGHLINQYISEHLTPLGTMAADEHDKIVKAYKQTINNVKVRQGKNIAAARLNNGEKKLADWDTHHLDAILRLPNDKRRAALDNYLMLLENSPLETGKEYKMRSIQEFKRLLAMKGLNMDKGPISRMTFDALVRVTQALDIQSTEDWYPAIFGGGNTREEIEDAILNDYNDHHKRQYKTI